jgi:hypothetical protein
MPGDPAALLVLAERVRGYLKTGVKLNEANTKATLVEPLLEWLGWDIHDPSEVSREWRRKGNEEPVDYALLGDGGSRLLLVEAKSLADNLRTDKGWRQLAANGVSAGFNWCVRTNGQSVILVNLLHHAELEEKVFWEIDLSQVGAAGGLPIEETGALLMLISKSALAERETDKAWDVHQGKIRAQGAVTALLASPPKALVDLVCDTAGEPRLPQDAVIQCLRGLQSATVATGVPRRARPAAKARRREAPASPLPTAAAPDTSAPSKSGKGGIVHIADGAFPIAHAKGILVAVAEWLASQGRIRPGDYPIIVSKRRTSEPKRYLISAKPVHPNGREFFAPVQLSNGGYLETHASLVNLEQQSKQLLRWAGYDDSILWVEWK